MNVPIEEKKSFLKQKIDVERLSLPALAEERLMLGLRTKKGVNISELEKRYQFSLSQKQLNYLKEKQKLGLVDFHNDGIALTTDGLKIADSIILDLITSA